MKQWMIDLANKHGLEPDTVRIFYEHIAYDPHTECRKGVHRSSLSYIMNPVQRRKRVEDFFDLYFEGRNSNGYN